MTAEEKATAFRSARQQLTQIPGVRNLAVGEAMSRYTQSPYQYALSMEFVDQAALALYMDHPLHQQFRKVFFPVREDPPVSMDFAELEDVD